MQDIVILLLASSLSFVVGAFMMWRNMRPQLERAQREFEGMREAFLDKKATNEKLFEGQQRIWEAYKELLNYKLKP